MKSLVYIQWVRSTGDNLELEVMSEMGMGAVLYDGTLNLWNLMLRPGRQYQNRLA